jgi:hypothetical protein
MNLIDESHTEQKNLHSSVIDTFSYYSTVGAVIL